MLCKYYNIYSEKKYAYVVQKNIIISLFETYIMKNVISDPYHI